MFLCNKASYNALYEGTISNDISLSVRLSIQISCIFWQKLIFNYQEMFSCFAKILTWLDCCQNWPRKRDIQQSGSFKDGFQAQERTLIFWVGVHNKFDDCNSNCQIFFDSSFKLQMYLIEFSFSVVTSSVGMLKGAFFNLQSYLNLRTRFFA